MPEEIQMTPEGHRRLEETLHKERARRDEAVTTMSQTRDEENSLEDLGMQAGQPDLPGMEARILELEDALERAVIVDTPPAGAGEVVLGAVVVLHDQTHDRELKVQLVSGVEVSALAGGPAQVSDDSPVGRALLGRRAGESFEVELPGGTVQYGVREITGA
ncbi:GreA/GreB family elongation factor [Deinococcus petrolearius]|uniref:GreA/GreB family elongation factor n=1 Tax=Deinococcus petrolearius TaxID=1751295 RepID=A0ABW1DH99_9DEIO